MDGGGYPSGLVGTAVLAQAFRSIGLHRVYAACDTRNDGDVTAVFAMVSAKMTDPMAETNAHENFWV